MRPGSLPLWMAAGLLGGSAALASSGCGPKNEPVTRPPPGIDTGGTTGGDAQVLTGKAVEPQGTVLGEPLTSGLVRVRFGDGPGIGGTLAAAPLGLDGAILIPWFSSPPPQAPEAVSTTHTGVKAAFYLPLVFDDANADSAYQEGERIYGAALDFWLVYLSGSGNDGWPRGWSLADLGMAGQYEDNRCMLDTSLPLEWSLDRGYPEFYGLDETLEISLRGLAADLELDGVIVSLPLDATGLAGLSHAAAVEGAKSDPVFDIPLKPGQQQFSVQLHDEPPPEDDHNADSDWRYTMHLPLVYSDADGSGAYTAGDLLNSATLCQQDVPVHARYTRPISTYRGHRMLDCYDGTVGWRAAFTDPQSGALHFLSAEQAADLTLDSKGCQF